MPVAEANLQLHPTMPADPLATELPLLDLFDAEYLEYYGVFPLSRVGDRVYVAVTGQPCREVIDDLAATFSATVEVHPAELDAVRGAIQRTYNAVQSVDALVKSLDHVADSSEGLDGHPEADARDLANQPPVVRYVNLLIREAHGARASDIHMESTAHGLVVRYRIDGILSGAPSPPPNIQAAVVSRVKLVADLDIAERRVPQDGRIRIRLEDQDLDLRVSTVPTLHGESVVLRLLDHGGAPEDLAALGMDEDLRNRFTKAARRPHGIILATGPTGSGKTTTLYSALRLRDAASEKIITVEDPVEYQLPGVTQVPVNVRAGMTFAAGLRSILRQDPDIVMVGEMRDAETARIAVQAAMTGHLVFSTVHTNDAASAVTRIVDLGIEPYMVAATVQAVLAQRLVRRICRHCVERTPGSSADLALLQVVEHGHSFRRGGGCALCRQSGYHGRVGLFELLVVDGEVRDTLARTPDAERIRAAALGSGMRPLREDGRQKVLSGITTAEEVLRAVQE
jgi:general secretion pathway protein E